MVRFTCTVVVLAALMASLPREAMAQSPVAAPGRPVADWAGWTEPDPLPGLPRPPDQPASLYQPAPAGQVYGCREWECPYFQREPRLDPADLPQPGWLCDVDVGILGSHVLSRVGQFASPLAAPVPFDVSVPMARLDWTVSPRFELGYRLPAGFGEVDVAYRFLLAQGTGSTADPLAAPDATAALRSRLDLNLGDLDYASCETSLGPCWGMKWRIGLRTADVFFDSRADEPLATAELPGRSRIFERSISNNFWGIGPHAALELSTRRNPWGLGWVGRLDSGLLFGRVRQKFAEVSTTGSSDSFDLGNPQQVPMLSGFLGLDWRPPYRMSLDILLGYTAEYWWNVGRLSDPDLYSGHSAGEAGTQGAVFRVEYNY
jgi:hypothetical protein